VIDLKLDLVPASAPAWAPATLCKAAVTLTAGCAHLRRSTVRPVLAVDSHQKPEFEGQEDVLVNDKCLRPLDGAIATAQLPHELSGLDPVAQPCTAHRRGDPASVDVHAPCRSGGRTILIAARYQRALRPTTRDRADPDTELVSACSVGDGR
jgi:hypothetical protein